MSLHHNARSCPHSRALMVDRIQRGDPVVRVEAELGVSPRTVYTWLGRYCQQGFEGLRDSFSQPHRIPRQMAAPCVDQIVQLRHRRMVSASAVTPSFEINSANCVLTASSRLRCSICTPGLRIFGAT